MIGKVITQLLKASDPLKALVPELSWYPYVANEDTPLPLIIYTINDLDPEYNKDGWVADDCVFSIVTFSEDYANIQEIVAQVRKALELKKGIYGTINIHRIELTGQDEGFNIAEGVFLNRLTFSVRIRGY